MAVFFRWLLGPIWHVMFYRARTARQATLLWTLSVAVDRHVALVPFLEALSDEAGGKWRYRLRGLADLLNSGVSIPDALEAVSDLLPEETLIMIRVGAESGQLGPALREAAARFSRRSESPPVVGGSGLAYFCALGLVMVNFTAFVMYFVIPKFKAIFSGFNIELPELTISLIEATDFAIDYLWLVGPLALGGLLLLGAIAFEFMSLSAGVMAAPAILSRLLPRLRTPTLLRCLGLAVDGARSFHETLELLLIRHPSPAMRRRLSSVEQAVSEGIGCWESLYAAGLLSQRDAGLLAAAERVGNLSWALRGVADSIERRTEQKVRLISEFARPLGVLAAGTVVGLFVVGMFIPIVKVLFEMPIEGASL